MVHVVVGATTDVAIEVAGEALDGQERERRVDVHILGHRVGEVGSRRVVEHVREVDQVGPVVLLFVRLELVLAVVGRGVRPEVLERAVVIALPEVAVLRRAPAALYELLVELLDQCVESPVRAVDVESYNFV